MASEPPAAPLQGAAVTGTPIAWTGNWLLLPVSASALMQQTANGTTIFVSMNGSQQNNAGLLYLTSGGSQPLPVNVPALTAQPGLLMNNWQANNLSVNNQSDNQQTSIWISLYGPGIPGQQPRALSVGTPTTLTGGQSAQGTAKPQFMQLTLQCTDSTLCVFGVIGGRLDSTGNNGYVISLNDSQNGNTGPNTGKTPPDGYYATTSGNTYKFQFNWGSSTVYVANMSAPNASSTQVTLSAF
ncbi:hypothetical protein [Longimicrobium sp.]|uniref:hypothetical protein n=1 Tax=Longimicrobium sp. TaxID=2029185 RepID=UPI003B3BC43A